MRETERRTVRIAAVFGVLGVIFWLIPGIHFLKYLCWEIGGLLLIWLGLCRWAERSRAGRWCRRVFSVLLAAVVAVLLGAEVQICMEARRDFSALPTDAVIVLGAGVNGDVPSLALQSRLDRAAAYLEQHPGIPAVLSGSQGPGENLTEAEAMKRYLLSRHPDWADRLILEDQSHSTAQNFRYSSALLRERGFDGESGTVAFVTNGFHLYRAHLLAQSEGLISIGVPAPLPWWVNVDCYAREPFALVKTILFDIALPKLTGNK